MINYRSTRQLAILFRLLWVLTISALAFGWTFVFESSPGLAQAGQACTQWDLAADFRLYPNQQNPNPDSCGNPDVWYFMRSDLSRQAYTLLDSFEPAVWGIPGLQNWGNTYPDQLPAVGINATGQDQYYENGTLVWPAGAINVHPLYTEDVVVGWRSPMDGFVSVDGSVKDNDPGWGNGINWFIDQNSTNLVSGSIEEGGLLSFRDAAQGYLLESTYVQQGDFLYFAIDPKDGNYGWDSTDLKITITPTGPPTGIFFGGQTKQGGAGQEVAYLVTLTNWTGNPDSFTLSLGTHNWQASLSPNPIGPVDNGQQATFMLLVTLPQDASVGSSDSVEVTATSVANPTGYLRMAVFTTVVAPPPVAGFSLSVWDPSRYDDIQFYNYSYDPVGASFHSAAWDFGDGTTSAEWSPIHRYAADGDYTVQMTATTVDGRSASVAQLIQVRTRNVAITRFVVPQSASAGQNRQITVYISNKESFNETVTVQLFKSTPDGEVWVGTLTQYVPARSANRTVYFAFSYTFTRADAAAGSVTFRAVASLPDARDALPADNEVIASPTRVGR